MMERIKWKETWAADLSGEVLSYIRIRLANLFSLSWGSHMQVPRWDLFCLLNVIQQISVKSSCTECLLTQRKQDCYLRLNAHLGVLLACFPDCFVLGKEKESLRDLLGRGIHWGVLGCWSSCDVALVMSYLRLNALADLFDLIDLFFFLVGVKI